jgi:NH3-dependent NAD+ synthetase
MSIDKFNQRITHLSDKISISKTPVPGFIMGLSGTDSIVAFILCWEAMREHNLDHRVHGIHYVDENRKKPTWFEEHIIPWLEEKYATTIEVRSPITQVNDEASRWHDLHTHAVNLVHTSKMEGNSPYYPVSYHKNEEMYWVAATVNATEKYLGTYSIQAKSASIWPISTLWKSDIMDICYALNVPSIAMEKATIPDCICGRDELAANNIRYIDRIIRNTIDPTHIDSQLLKDLIDWIRETKNTYDFDDKGLEND